MPDSIPPTMRPDDDFDLEAELDRIARAVLIQRHRDIPAVLIDDLLENDDALREEYETLIDLMRHPAPARRLPRSGYLAQSGVKIFDVTESPEGEIEIRMGRFNGRYAIVNAYNLHYVPNRPRRGTAPWSTNFGGNR